MYYTYYLYFNYITCSSFLKSVQIQPLFNFLPINHYNIRKMYYLRFNYITCSSFLNFKHYLLTQLPNQSADLTPFQLFTYNHYNIHKKPKYVLFKSDSKQVLI